MSWMPGCVRTFWRGWRDAIDGSPIEQVLQEHITENGALALRLDWARTLQHRRPAAAAVLDPLLDTHRLLRRKLGLAGGEMSTGLPARCQGKTHDIQQSSR